MDNTTFTQPHRRPADEELLTVLALHFRAPAKEVLEWLETIDFLTEQKRIEFNQGA